MFISKKKYLKIIKDVSWLDLRITILEQLVSSLSDQLFEVIDNNHSIIDTNKLVLDKLEEYLKVNNLE